VFLFFHGKKQARLINAFELIFSMTFTIRFGGSINTHQPLKKNSVLFFLGETECAFSMKYQYIDSYETLTTADLPSFYNLHSFTLSFLLKKLLFERFALILN